MMSRTPVRLTAIALVCSLVVSGCYGPFNLTRRLYRWNSRVGDKWEREFMFLLLVWAPAYAFTTLADAIVFNSLEFWTGKNPVEPPRAGAPQIRRIARGEDAAVLTYTAGPQGPVLLIRQFHAGRPAGEVRLERRADASIALDNEGRILFSVRTEGAGQLVAFDAQHHPALSSALEAVRVVTRELQ